MLCVKLLLVLLSRPHMNLCLKVTSSAHLHSQKESLYCNIVGAKGNTNNRFHIIVNLDAVLSVSLMIICSWRQKGALA